jgi:hypothetical protein
MLYRILIAGSADSVPECVCGPVAVACGCGWLQYSIAITTRLPYPCPTHLTPCEISLDCSQADTGFSLTELAMA